MAKSEKATVLRRVQEVVRLLVAGAEFAEIRQYASAQGWKVSDRQLRRYTETAYQRLAKSTARNSQQLLGRHLMQRRALYARSLKGNDLRTALQVLRDEAALQGLYPAKNDPVGSQDQTRCTALEGPPLSRRQRLVSFLAAEAAGDRTALRLVKQATPRTQYSVPDTMLPMQMLHTMTLIYVAEQLEHAGMFLHAVWRGTVEGDADGVQDLLAVINSFLFRIGREGWQQFARELGVDGEYLVRENHQGSLLALCQDNICRVAPSAEQVLSLINQGGQGEREVASAASRAKSWHRLLSRVLQG